MAKSIISSVFPFIAGTIVLLALPYMQAKCQNPDNIISEQNLTQDISFLADDLCQGRASGTEGAIIAGEYITERFRKLGLAPYNWSYTQSFRHKDSIVLRNIVGVLYSPRPSSGYIIVGAHYDHIGKIKGNIYNGADDNASGVAAMLSLADAFSKRKRLGYGLPCNLIFIAFDGKEQSMAGSRYFAEHLPFPTGSIKCAIDIDIIGSDLVPLHSHRSDYLIALGESSLPSGWRGRIGSLCADRRYNLDLDLQFYGSREFTKMMYELGDHGTFAAKHIPTVFFTSGFHHHTYKSTDDADIINIPLLKKRTAVIFRFIDFIGRMSALD